MIYSFHCLIKKSNIHWMRRQTKKLGSRGFMSADEAQMMKQRYREMKQNYLEKKQKGKKYRKRLRKHKEKIIQYIKQNEMYESKILDLQEKLTMTESYVLLSEQIKQK